MYSSARCTSGVLSDCVIVYANYANMHEGVHPDAPVIQLVLGLAL